MENEVMENEIKAQTKYWHECTSVDITNYWHECQHCSRRHITIRERAGLLAQVSTL